MFAELIIVIAFRLFWSRTAASFSRDAMLRHADFRRIWFSSALTSFGEQISSLALPLTAVLLLHATPAQMGTLIALQAAPFALFSLPVGVWLDRRSKFSILLRSVMVFPFALASVPLAYWMGWLSMHWLYAVGFMMGTGFVVYGSASQVFLTHVVGRDQLIDAHSKFASTDSAARLVGPGIAGVLVQAISAPLALLVQAAGFLVSWANLRTIIARDPQPEPAVMHPVRDIIAGLAFVKNNRILWTLAWGAALWQVLFHGYMALQILFATRELGMSPGVLGAAQMLGGLGVLASSIMVKPLTRRFGTGRTILLGMAGTALGWTLLSLTPVKPFGLAWGSAAFYSAVVFLFDCGAMLFSMPYLALRQRVTPDALLGRMVSTMRFMTVAAAPLGALLAGALAQYFGLRAGLSCVAVGGIALTLALVYCSPLTDIERPPVKLPA